MKFQSSYSVGLSHISDYKSSRDKWKLRYLQFLHSIDLTAQDNQCKKHNFKFCFRKCFQSKTEERDSIGSIREKNSAYDSFSKKWIKKLYGFTIFAVELLWDSFLVLSNWFTDYCFILFFFSLSVTINKCWTFFAAYTFFCKINRSNLLYLLLLFRQKFIHWDFAFGE